MEADRARDAIFKVAVRTAHECVLFLFRQARLHESGQETCPDHCIVADSGRKVEQNAYINFQPEMTNTVARTGRMTRSGMNLVSLLPMKTPGSDPISSIPTMGQLIVPAMK